MASSNTYNEKASVDTYPSAQIDPREKSYNWILQYTRAAYNDSKGWMPFSQLNSIGNIKMAEIKMYAMGKQPVDKYKKIFSPGSPTDDSWRAIDWTVPAFMCKYREIELSKLHQKKYDFQAFAVDPMARSEEDAYFNKMKVKILMREAAEQAGSELANSPQLAPQPGEPEDMEQLKMEKDCGYKHVMAMQGEQAINLVFQQNNMEEMRTQIEQNLYDYGIAAMTQYLDENGMVKERPVNMEYFGSSYFEKPDGSDMVHWFEIVPTYVADLAPYYTKEQLDEICQKVVAKNGNPGMYQPVTGFFNQAWSRFKVLVMQIKFLSWNDTIYKEETDNRGNLRLNKSSYQNSQFLSVNKTGNLEEQSSESDPDGYFEDIRTSGDEGSATPKYIKSTRKVSYKASWVIDTNYMHDYGLRENQNRKLSSWWDTDLDIQLYAWNFYKMQFTGITERLIPIEDKACQIWFNLQNLSNKLIPYLINMDMNSIEGAFPFGKGGTKGKPSDVIDFIFSNFVVPYRSTDLHSRNPNYKPVTIEATGQLTAFAALHDELERTLEYMRQISGLNEATDASTVNAKNLNSTNEAMVESTNNAIYPIANAEKNILLRTADAAVQKVQIAVKLGKVEGYAKALGSQAVQFFRINPDIALHELGIFIDEAPTQAQREALWNDATIKESQGLLTIGDKYFLMTVRDLKQAYMILDYKIEKRKEQQQQFEIQKIQEAAQQNAQVAQATEQMKQQTIQMQGQIDIQKIIIEKQLDYKTEFMKKQTDLQGELAQSQGRLDVGEIAANAKIIASQITAHSSLIGKHIDGEKAKEKQEIANKKPKAAAK